MQHSILLVAGLLAGQAAAPKNVTVQAPTRLDWAFAAQGFGKEAGGVPASYDSTKQRYQLFVPNSYTKAKAAPLVVFISPSDQPAGWNAWRQVAMEQGVLFVSPFAAGNNVAAGQRVRVVLDVLDDVRRAYRIDPDQTYLSGFSGGGRMACSIAFALPEYFGGVVPVCGTNALTGAAYQRHLLEDRLSVAFVTGATDFNRKENEAFMAPWFAEIGIRSKLWVVPNLGHAIPNASVIGEVYAWLKDDLPRRRKAAVARPKLAVAPEEGPAAADQAQRWLATAQGDLREPQSAWRGVALLQGVRQRWGKTPAGNAAAKVLQQVLNDEKLLGLVGDQGAVDEQKSLSAQAKALEAFGQTKQALNAWEFLAKAYADTPFGRKAAAQVQRLRMQ